MALTAMPEDILLVIFSQTTVRDVLAVRQTCRNLCAATRAKQLWLGFLSEVRSGIVSPYCKPSDDLSGSQVESLTLHSLRMQSLLRRGSGHPASTVSLHQTRPVTWVRTFQGSWLLAASSDSTSSVLSLWSLRATLSVDNPNKGPDHEVYLQGPVADGEVEVQDGRVIVVLEIRSPDPFIQVLSLCNAENGRGLVDVARYSGLSRLRCLSGTFIGAALHNGMSLPCVLNWATGSILHLRKRPDREGGCVAMAICDRIVATASAHKIELYTLEDGFPSSCKQVGRFDLPLAAIGYAALSFVASSWKDKSTPRLSPASLRVCITTWLGISVYEILLPPHDVEISIHETWTIHRPLHQDYSKPRFGQTPDHVSWHRSYRWNWKTIDVNAAWLPDPRTSHDFETILQDSESTFTFTNEAGPALYCAGVRHFDETRGVLVLGSAFGELEIYDFSGTDAVRLEECFEQLDLRQVANARIMPTAPIRSAAALPFPYSGPLEPQPPYDTFTSAWRPFQPSPAPLHWSTSFHLDPDEDSLDDYDPEDLDRATDPSAFIPTMHINSGRQFECVLHLIGDPIPLMYHRNPSMTVADIGGLLVILGPDGTWTFEPGVTLTDIAHAQREGRLEDLPCTEIKQDGSIERVELLFERMWRYEWGRTGRNRWQELKDRGGEVDPSWLEGGRPERYPEGFSGENPILDTGLEGVTV